MANPVTGRGPALGWPLGPVAHRGLHNLGSGCIENTTSAFAAAIARGYAIECDLQAALGHEPMVFHDELLDRLMEARGPVSARAPAELAKLAYRDAADHIPTLDQLLAQVAGRVPLFIEIKTVFDPPGRFEEKIAASLIAYRGPVAIMSFDHKSVATMRSLAPDVPRGMISYRWDDDWMPQVQASERVKLRDLAYSGEVQPSFIAYDIDDLPEPAPLGLRAKLGIPLLTWTVRTPEQRERAARYADAIIFEGFEP